MLQYLNFHNELSYASFETLHQIPSTMHNENFVIHTFFFYHSA